MSQKKAPEPKKVKALTIIESDSKVKKEENLKRTEFKTVTNVDCKNVNLDSISYVDTEKTVHMVHPYNVMYKYSPGNDHSLKLNIYCDNIKLSQSRKGVTTTKYNSFLRLGKSDRGDQLLGTLKRVKEWFIDYLVDKCGINFDKYYLIGKRDEEVKIFIGNGNKFPNIVKLGSVSEKNINTEITNVEQLDKLLKDYRYNNEKTESYYEASMIINISCCVYEKLYDGKKISFKPYIKIMEMKYNKAHCIPLMKTKENIVVTDNVLVL